MIRTASKVRSESRVVRPVADNDFLQATQLCLQQETESFSGQERFSLGTLRPTELAPVLRLPCLPSNFFASIGCQPMELRLIVWISDPSLKQHYLCWDQTLSDDWPEDINIRSDQIGSVSWAPNTRLGVSIVLANSRDASFGLASRRGHWVAQKTFRVAAAEVGIDVPLVYWSDENFAKAGYAAETCYAIHIADPETLNVPLAPDGSLPIEIRFSERLGHKMVNAHPPVVATITASVQVNLLLEILRSGLRAMDEGELIDQEAPLSRFLALTAKRSGWNPEDIVTVFVKDNYAAKSEDELRSALEASFGLRDAFIDALIR
jgi:hypothetical protein